MTSVATAKKPPRARPVRGIVLVTPASDAMPLDEVRAAFPDADVEVTASVAERARDARKEARPFVAVVGGDRAARAAASELAHGETALLPVPADTHHFATAVGIT